MAIRFTSLLRDLIIESSRFQVVYDKYVKPNKKTRKSAMTFQTLFDIIAADPTSRIPEGMTSENAKPEDMESVKIGKYTQWILKNFTSPSIQTIGIDDPNDPAIGIAFKRYQEMFMEDLYKVTGDLMKYEKFKGRLPEEYRDINKLTPSLLYDQVKDFSLEKTKASKEEKQLAATTYQHPGAEIVYRGTNWTVAKISDQGQLGKDAAVFYGGNHHDTQMGETRWCTSSKGYNWFERYISKGPLYVIIPNSPRKFNTNLEVGQTSGLPALRYQFHFQDNQFMDPADHQIDWIKFLNEEEPGLKEFFKPEIAKNLVDINQNKVSVTYPNDASSKYIALYGFDEFFENLPDNIKRIEFKTTSSSNFEYPIPESIGRFKDLTSATFQSCTNKIPESICNCKKLQFLSLVNNPNLEMLPSCLADIEDLLVINLPGSNRDKVLPESLLKREQEDDDFMIAPQASW
jgi:hypothetical protein